MKKLITLLTLTGLLFFATSTFADPTQTDQTNANATTETVTTDQTNANANAEAAPASTSDNASNAAKVQSTTSNTEKPSGSENSNGKSGFNWMTIVFWVLLIVVIYFFMIRPASKRKKEAEKFKESLKKGSKVITASGVYGIVDEIGDTYVLLEIANGVKIKMDKNSIVSFTDTDAQESNDKK